MSYDFRGWSPPEQTTNNKLQGHSQESFKNHKAMVVLRWQNEYGTQNDWDAEWMVLLIHDTINGHFPWLRHPRLDSYMWLRHLDGEMPGCCCDAHDITPKWSVLGDFNSPGKEESRNKCFKSMTIWWFGAVCNQSGLQSLIVFLYILQSCISLMYNQKTSSYLQ